MAGSDDNATEILPSSSQGSAARAPKAAAAAEPGELVGRTLGKFAIVERLGRGGSGEVFRAEQAALGRSAVIKVLRQTGAATNRVERFLREAKLASRLDHPYAAHVYAFGAEPDGVLWIAMEHVRGATLDELVARRGAMPATVFAPLFARLCEVVHSAHELGIIHRDIKGSNVMVIERSGQLLPKLLDFGIAKAAAESSVSAGEPVLQPASDDDSLTAHGSTLGSPHYMSPEQWDSPHDVDARADIYALGVLAYRCVAGHLPFRGADRAQLPDAHRNEPPPPLPRTVGDALGEVILRALAKARTARWPSALAFGEAVRVAVGGAVPDAVPIFDPNVRDAWVRGAPQPIADAVARLAAAGTAVEADIALRELIAIVCRWLAVVGLSLLGPEARAITDVAESARAVSGRDDAGPWLRLARAASAASTGDLLPGFAAALAGADAFGALADRLDDRDHARTVAALAFDIAAAADALGPLEPLLAYQLVVWRVGRAESWQGARRRERAIVVVWGEPLPDGTVALLDGTGRVVTVLSPLVQIVAPLPSSEPELFLLWRSGRGTARLVAAPWGFERDDDAAARRLASLTTEDSDTAADQGEDSPYLGLAAYGVHDAERFVGREREVESLANRLVRAPLLAVLGPSGAGKSSFIHAGLLPRLAEHYEIITMRPGRHPVAALAALPPLNGADPDDAAALAAKLRELGERAPRGLVVVIDQLEELVTLCTDAAERARFAEALAAAADGPSAPVRVVVTLRDDFATVIESEAAFRGRFEVFVLATPPPDALRRIVTEPARRAAVTVDAQVVDDMVAEVAGRAASLPLLSFTTAQLWRVRDRAARRITHDAYLALGGVAGALSTYADQVYGSLARRDQDVVRDLFARLVANDGTRIPAPRAELEELPGARAVLAHLIDARLLVVREDVEDQHDIVEIVHECLAERWPRLARWRTEDAADRALLGDVRAAARRWQDTGRRADLLWHGQALGELRRLAARSGALTDTERAFAAAAARAQTRSRRIRRALVGAAMVVLAGVAVALGALSLAANRSRSAAEQSAGEARDAARLAEDRFVTSLVAQGRRELNDGRALNALAYFGEALRRGADTPALRELVAFAERGWKYVVRVARGQGIVEITGSRRGGWLAMGTISGGVQIWSATGTVLGDVPVGLGYVNDLHVRADDRLIVTARDGAALVDAPARTVVETVRTKTAVFVACWGPGADEVSTVEHGAIRVYARGAAGAATVKREVEFTELQGQAEPFVDAACRHVALGGNAELTSYDLATLKPTVIARELTGEPGGTDDGLRLGYAGKDRQIHVIGFDGKAIATFRPVNAAHAVLFSPTGDRIGAIDEHAIAVYDARGELQHVVPVETDGALGMLLGDETWIGNSDGVVRRYRGETLVASLPVHVTNIDNLWIGEHVALAMGNDQTVVAVRADAAQFVSEARPCQRPTYSTDGNATVYLCEDERQLLYIGDHLVGDMQHDDVSSSAYDPATGLSLVSGETVIVYGKDGARLAQATRANGHVGLAAFADATHVLVAADDGVWRWAFGATGPEAWARVSELHDLAALVTAAGGTLYATRDGALLLARDGRELHRTDAGAKVMYLTASADGRWVAATLMSGVTAIVDGQTGEIVRRLAPSDAGGGASMLDAHGDLLIRPSRGYVSIWDRASGENILFNVDLLHGIVGGAFLPDGRLGVAGREVGVLDLARDARPPAEIVRDIDCRVPLRVNAGRLEPAATNCK